MDKFLILIITGVVLAGGLIYDRHKIAQDGVSPIGQMLDSVGLGRYIDWEKMTHASTSRHFHAEAGENLERMAQRHHEIQDKRREFVQHREEILGQLVAMNQEIQNLANHYTATLEKQREAINKQFPEIERSIAGLLASYANGNDVVTPAEYQRFKEDLLKTLREVVPDPELAWPDLAGMLDDLEPMLTVHGHAALGAGNCESPAGCVDQKISDITDLMKNFGTEAQNDINGVIRSAEALAGEYDTFRVNMESSEERFDGLDERVAGEFRALAQKLTQVSEKDLRDLMALYRAFQEEQMVLLNNLRLHGQRLWENQQEFERRVEQTTERFQKAPCVDAAAWMQAVAGRHKKQGTLLMELTADEDDLQRLLKERWEENQRYMKGLAAAVGLKINEIMAARQVMESVKPTAPSVMATRQAVESVKPATPTIRMGPPQRNTSVAGPSTKMNPSRSPNLAEKTRELRNAANSGYQNLREKARDTGRW